MMKNKTWLCIFCMLAAVLVAAGVKSTLAQDNDGPTRLSGVINDYAPTGSATTAWELHGPWSLTLDKETGKGHLSAALTMGFSILGQNSTAIQSIALQQHTHNITMDGAVIYNPTDCPGPSAGALPLAARIEIKDTASVFANGNVPPFGQFSGLQVCIYGGVSTPNLSFSNITLKFADGAATHFGSQAIHGVVRRVQTEHRNRDH